MPQGFFRQGSWARVCAYQTGCGSPADFGNTWGYSVQIDTKLLTFQSHQYMRSWNWWAI